MRTEHTYITGQAYEQLRAIDLSQETARPLDICPLTAHGYIDCGAPADGDAFYVIVNGTRKDFELNSVGGVTAGRIAIAIAGTASDTAVNIQRALREAFGNFLIFSTRAWFTDVAGANPEVSLAIGNIAGGLVNGVFNSAQRARPSVALFFERELFGVDVLRGGLAFVTTIDKISFAQVTIRTSLFNGPPILWTGQMSIPSPGVVALANIGATPFVAGNYIQLIVMGDKYE